MAFGKRNHKKSDKRKSVDENSDSSHRRDNQTDIDHLRSLTSKKQKDFLSLIITVPYVLVYSCWFRLYPWRQLQI